MNLNKYLLRLLGTAAIAGSTLAAGCASDADFGLESTFSCDAAASNRAEHYRWSLSISGANVNEAEMRNLDLLPGSDKLMLGFKGTGDVWERRTSSVVFGVTAAGYDDLNFHDNSALYDRALDGIQVFNVSLIRDRPWNPIDDYKASCDIAVDQRAMVEAFNNGTTFTISGGDCAWLEDMTLTPEAVFDTWSVFGEVEITNKSDETCTVDSAAAYDWTVRMGTADLNPLFLADRYPTDYVPNTTATLKVGGRSQQSWSVEGAKPDYDALVNYLEFEELSGQSISVEIKDTRGDVFGTCSYTFDDQLLYDAYNKGASYRLGSSFCVGEGIGADGVTMSFEASLKNRHSGTSANLIL